MYVLKIYFLDIMPQVPVDCHVHIFTLHTCTCIYIFLLIDFSGFEDNMVSLYGSIIIIMIKW